MLKIDVIASIYNIYILFENSSGFIKPILLIID